MDLQTISSQMKIVIQKHQIVVTEMRNDPQNPVLQKRLRDLQAEIHSLNERQKQIVEDLRKNLETKQNPHTSSPRNLSGFVVNSSTHIPLSSSPEVRTEHPPKPVVSCLNPVPPPANNVATFTFKAPVVLPNCSIGNNIEQQKMQPVLVVPSPSNRSSDNQPTSAGVFFNLVPPIRVPQYPPRTPSPNICQKPQIVNNFLPLAPLTSVTAPISFQSNSITENPLRSTENSPVHLMERPSQSSEILNHKVDQKKSDFLSALGLVTKDCFSDMKNKKQERKRRSTANPQFSNAALEEKWSKAAAAAAAASNVVGQKRPRGRPRLESKPVACPTNGICSGSEIKPASPPDNSSANCTISSSSSPFSDCSTTVNGLHKQALISEDGKNMEQMLSGLCIVCTQPGDLVKCDTCAKQQHPGCMQPPLVARPQAPWQCCDCQARTASLAVVQSYDVLKAAKEDEKRKLLKKSLELRLKRSQLEGRLLQLRELSGKQKNRQSELQTSTKGVEALLDRMHGVVNGVRLCS